MKPYLMMFVLLRFASASVSADLKVGQTGGYDRHAVVVRNSARDEYLVVWINAEPVYSASYAPRMGQFTRSIMVPGRYRNPMAPIKSG